MCFHAVFFPFCFIHLQKFALGGSLVSWEIWCGQVTEGVYNGKGKVWLKDGGARGLKQDITENSREVKGRLKVIKGERNWRWDLNSLLYTILYWFKCLMWRWLSFTSKRILPLKRKILVTQKQIRSFYSRWLLNHSYSKKSRPLLFYLAERTG